MRPVSSACSRSDERCAEICGIHPLETMRPIKPAPKLAMPPDRVPKV